MNDNNIKGKNILLIIPDFHQYTNMVVDTLSGMGANVITIQNKHFFLDHRVTTTVLGSIRKVFFKLLRPDLVYFKRKIKPVIEKSENVDYLFCINCDCLSKPVFDAIDLKYPNAIKILYLWDSLAIFKYESFIKYFDQAFSFDFHDSTEYKIKYLPNFIVPDLHKGPVEKKYDLYFIGQQYGYRVNYIKKIYQEAIDKKLNVLIKLYVNPQKKQLFKFLYKVLKYVRAIKSIDVFCLNYELGNNIVSYPFITHEAIPLTNALEELKRSKCIIDVCFEDQIGASHRVMQALYYNLKIITNNKLIIHEEFYSPDYIKISKAGEDSAIDTTWINKPSMVDEKLIDKYVIDNWLLTIFSR